MEEKLNIPTKIPFKVSARAGKLLGRENFSNPEGAITELVKNSYDADAENCLVIFDIPLIQIEDENGFKITDNELKNLILTKDQAYLIYKDNQSLFEEIFEENVTQEDIVNLVYKKEQLAYFDKLLNHETFFEEEKVSHLYNCILS